MASSAQRPGDIIVGINVTPLVDVVLVLLIVLMVAASHAASQGLRVELPKAASGEPTSSGPLAISIDAGGGLFLNGEAVSRESLRGHVQRHRAEDGRSAVIAADGATAHRAVVGVIDLLRTEGIAQFAINVAPADLPP